ncbi:hypothetical protein ACLMJK_003804 [Lecanora helva]
MSVSYTCHELPKNAEDLSTSLDRYVSFRLDALVNAAGQVAATYTYESTFTRQMWMSRLLDPKKHHLVVVAHETAAHGLESLDNGEWVGMMSLLGPLSKFEYFGSDSESSEIKSDDEEVRFDMSSVYINPSHRGGEATLQMFEQVLNVIRSLADDLLSPPPGTIGSARIRGTIAPSNTNGFGFQEALGFRSIDWWSKAQAYRAIDFAEVIAPEEEAPELYHVKDQRVIEHVLEC